MFQSVSVHELFRLGYGLLAAPSRSVSITGGMKVFFKDGLYDVENGLLDYSVPYGGYPQWSAAPIWFGYLYPLDGTWFICSRFECQFQPLGVFVKDFPVGFFRYAIYPGGAFVFLHLFVCFV